MVGCGGAGAGRERLHEVAGAGEGDEGPQDIQDIRGNQRHPQVGTARLIA